MVALCEHLGPKSEINYSERLCSDLYTFSSSVIQLNFKYKRRRLWCRLLFSYHAWWSHSATASAEIWRRLSWGNPSSWFIHILIPPPSGLYTFFIIHQWMWTFWTRYQLYITQMLKDLIKSWDEKKPSTYFFFLTVYLGRSQRNACHRLGLTTYRDISPEHWLHTHYIAARRTPSDLDGSSKETRRETEQSQIWTRLQETGAKNWTVRIFLVRWDVAYSKTAGAFFLCQFNPSVPQHCLPPWWRYTLSLPNSLNPNQLCCAWRDFYLFMRDARGGSESLLLVYDQKKIQRRQSLKLCQWLSILFIRNRLIYEGVWYAIGSLMRGGWVCGRKTDEDAFNRQYDFFFSLWSCWRCWRR